MVKPAIDWQTDWLVDSSIRRLIESLVRGVSDSSAHWLSDTALGSMIDITEISVRIVEIAIWLAGASLIDLLIGYQTTNRKNISTF